MVQTDQLMPSLCHRNAQCPWLLVDFHPLTQDSKPVSLKWELPVDQLRWPELNSTLIGAEQTVGWSNGWHFDAFSCFQVWQSTCTVETAQIPDQWCARLCQVRQNTHPQWAVPVSADICVDLECHVDSVPDWRGHEQPLRSAHVPCRSQHQEEKQNYHDRWKNFLYPPGLHYWLLLQRIVTPIPSCIGSVCPIIDGSRHHTGSRSL